MHHVCPLQWAGTVRAVRSVVRVICQVWEKVLCSVGLRGVWAPPVVTPEKAPARVGWWPGLCREGRPQVSMQELVTPFVCFLPPLSHWGLTQARSIPPA